VARPYRNIAVQTMGFQIRDMKFRII